MNTVAPAGSRKKKLGPRDRYKGGEVPMHGDRVKGQRGGTYVVDALGGEGYGPAGDDQGRLLLYLSGGQFPRIGVPNRYTLLHRSSDDAALGR